MEQTQKIRHLQKKQTPVACKRLYLNPKKSFETGTFSTSAMVNMVSIDTQNERVELSIFATNDHDLPNNTDQSHHI